MIKTNQDKDSQLHHLYQNKELYVFVNGDQWFNDQIKLTHQQWFFNQLGRYEDFAVNIGITLWAATHGYE